MQEEVKTEDMFVVGYFFEGGKAHPCSRFIGDAQTISPEVLAMMCIAIYDSVLNCCEESQQIDFENRFIEHFKETWENKEKYIFTRNLNE